MNASIAELANAAPEVRLAAARESIDRFTAEVEPLRRDLNEATWRSDTTGAEEHRRESARLENALRAILSRRDAFARFDTLARAGVPDPLVQRQLSLVVLEHRPHQIEPAMIERMVAIEKRLEQTFGTHRAELDGRRVSDNDIHQILRASTDLGQRQRAWEAAKQVGAKVADDLRALVALRNDVARGQGWDSYYTMMLSFDELDERELYGLLDDLEARTRAPFEAYKADLDRRLAARHGIAPEALRPWHYEDVFFQEAPATDLDLDPLFRDLPIAEVTGRFFTAVGLEVDDLLARADLYERPGKNQHAYCMSVDRGLDIRVLCNVKANERWMGTMLHEFGHAAYDKYIDPALPYGVRVPAHTLATEATAMLFGRLSKSAAWLERWAGMDPAAARATGAAAERATRRGLLVQTRWCLVMCHMERALYANPAADLDTLWWDLVERIQRVRRPEGRKAPDWASKIHFSLAPVYYHNYQLGEMMASQLQRHLIEEVLGGGDDAWARYVASPEVGDHLRRHLFAYGRTVDWREALRRSTGATLGAGPFAAELTDV
jgi:peptidyl-dipeptidase A